jgi:hypothetical protein
LRFEILSEGRKGRPSRGGPRFARRGPEQRASDKPRKKERHRDRKNKGKRKKR